MQTWRCLYFDAFGNLHSFSQNQVVWYWSPEWHLKQTGLAESKEEYTGSPLIAPLIPRAEADQSCIKKHTHTQKQL